MNKKHVGSDFDDFLREEGILEEVEANAWKRVIAYQITTEMKRKRMTKTAMAEQMKTSRAALERLLDPQNQSVTFATLQRAALVLGKRLKVELA